MPLSLQVECSPTLNQKDLIKFCKERDITITAYSPLGHPKVDLKTPAYFFDDNVQQIADKYGKTTAQIILRYLVRRIIMYTELLLYFNFFYISLNWEQFQFQNP